MMHSGGFDSSLWALLLQLGRGALIALLLWGLGWLIRVAPIPRRRRRLLERLGPVFVVFVGLTFLISAVQELFGSHAATMPVVAGLLLLGFGAALFWPLRDLVAGISVRAGDVLRPGDEVEVGGVYGRVERLGYRSVVVLASQGEVTLPYGAVARGAIIRAPGAHGATSHLFRVGPVAGLSALELRRAITEGALLCHWSSLSRPPEIRAAQDGGLDVTVFALHHAFGPEIEAAVRAHVEIAGEPPDGAAPRGFTAGASIAPKGR